MPEHDSIKRRAPRPAAVPLTARAPGAAIATSSTALKALRVLEAVAAGTGPSALGDIAARAALDKSTTYRMLSTLVSAGYVSQDGHSRRYVLSYRVVSLSRNLLADDEVFQLTRGVLDRLSSATGEAIHLCVLDGLESVLVQRVRGTQLVAVEFQVGDRSPLHCTSIGKALLAYQGTGLIDTVIAAGLPRMAVNTIVEPESLRRELRLVRERGYAIDDHELADTMRCIAVPIFELQDRVRMGISISGPDSRFTVSHLEWLRGPLLAASQTLSEQLGGVAPRS